MTPGFGIIGRHVTLSASLFLRYGAVLSAVWAGGMLLDQVLLRAAVEVAIHSRLLGLVAIAPVILLQLLVFVALFVILRSGLPRMRLRHLRKPTPAPTQAQPTSADDEGTFAVTLLAVLIPFYGYYAGWGLLGDTLRKYSQIFYATQTQRADFTKAEPLQTALDIGQTGWVILSILVIWAIRRFAKVMQARSSGGIWPMLVVACEATWALLGLYVIAGWKDGFAAWLATFPSPADLWGWLVPSASAAISDAGAQPVDWPPAAQFWPTLQSLFWYGLLPLVWFNLGAIVYGHDMDSTKGLTKDLAGFALSRWKALPKPVVDFIGHFYSGTVKRWHAVTNGVLLSASAGFALTASVVVLWRLVDWLGNWAWIGFAQMIGPQDMATWQVLSVALNALFGAPGAPAGGLLVTPLQFCILAAGLELANRAQEAAARKVRSEAVEAPA